MAGNIIACIGRYANHLEQLPVGNLSSSDADSSYPLDNLVGGFVLEPNRPFRHASPPGADRHVTIDKNVVVNGGGEVGDTSSWTNASVGASNTFANVSTPVNSGSRAFSLTVVTTGGSNKAEMRQERYIRAGERQSISIALRGDGTRVVRARLFIPETGEYLTSGGALSTTPQDFATRTAASYAPTAFTFTAPAYAAQQPTGIYTARLIVYLDGTSAGTVFMDDFYLWPSTDLAAVIGSGVKQAISPFELRRDAAAFAGAGTLEQNMGVLFPTFYASLGTIRDDRYWRYRAVGTNSEQIWYGKLWLGQKLTLVEKPQYGLTWRYINEQTRQETMGGAIKIYREEDFRRRQWDIPWEWVTEATFEEVRDRLFEQSSYGAETALLITDADDPESAAMVLVPNILEAANQSAQLREGRFTLDELAFPSFSG